jgi:hypothetical protein
MRFTSLIVFAATRAFEAEAQLGVRMSPIRINAEEAQALASELAQVESYAIHAALSVPGLHALEAARVCLSDGSRAAERATEWRNLIKPEQRERVVYIAAQRHGKAGGLQDTLLPLEDDALRRSFVEAHTAEDAARLLPGPIVAALDEAGIAAQLQSRTLCDWSEEVERRVLAGEDPWSAAGLALPRLGLMPDARLSMEEELAQRLRANDRIRRAASKGEVRGNKDWSKEAQALTQQLAAAMTHADGSDALKLVSLDELETAALLDAKERADRRAPAASAEPKKKRTAKQKEEPKAPERPAKAPSRSKKASQTAILEHMMSLPDEEQAEEEPVTAVTLEGASLSLPAALAETHEATRAEPQADEQAPQEAPLTPEHAASPAGLEETTSPMHRAAASAVREDAKPSERRMTPAAWAKQLSEAELGQSALLPHGLAELLLTSLSREGHGLTWHVAQAPLRSLLHKAPERLPTPEPILLDALEGPLATQLEAWRDARTTLAAKLIEPSKKGLSPLALFVHSPIVLLSDPVFRGLAAALVAASAALLQAAATAGLDAAAMRALLAADTISLELPQGPRLVILTPLHPLALGQALQRYEQIFEARRVPMMRRVMAQALAQSPVAPPRWPLPDGEVELPLTQLEVALIAYETNPAKTPDEEVREATTLVIKRYLALHPHALLGLQIVAEGDSPGPIIEGIAEVLRSDEQLVNVALALSGSGAGVTNKRANELIHSRRLRLVPRPDDLAKMGVHLILHTNPPLEQAEAHALSAELPIQNNGSLQTRFDISRDGIITRTPVRGLRGVEEVEALLAAARGRSPVGEFINAEESIRLSTLFPAPAPHKQTWQVAIGARISRVPRDGANLIAYEQVSELATVAILSESITAPARSLTEAFKLLGVADLRPRTLNALASSLAAQSSRGLCALERSGEQLVAAELLALELRSAANRRECVVAHITESSAVTLLGLEPTRDPHSAYALAIIYQEGALRFVLGYANLHAPAESISIERSTAEGQIAERLTRLMAVIELACSSDPSATASAAREAFNWLAWPALALSRGISPRFLDTMRGLSRGVQARFEARLMLPTSHPLAEHKGQAALDKALLTVRTLDNTRFDQLLMDSALE